MLIREPFRFVLHPGPNGDTDKYDGHNDPDDKWVLWEWLAFCRDSYECDYARDYHNDGQR